MPIKAIYGPDEFDPEKPPQLDASDWEQTDAGWRLRASGVEEVDGWGVGGLGKLNNALKDERKKRADANTELAEIRKIVGETTDADELRALIEKGRSETDPNTEAEVNTRVTVETKRIADEYREKLRAAEEKAATIEAQAATALGRNRLIVALTNAGADGEEAARLLAEGHQVRSKLQDGVFVDEVIDAGGNPAIDEKSGDNKTLADLVASAKSDPVKSRLFKGTGSSGSGADPAAARNGSVKPAASLDFENMSGPELLSRGRELQSKK